MGDQAGQTTPAVVRMPAEIDVTNSDQVYEELVAAFTPGVATVVADLTETLFCDSSGVHAIMHAYESSAARDIQLRLAVSPETSVHRVLQLIGVGHLLPVYADLEAALAG
jgi:anti-sigma B factor antagonist